MNEQLRINIEEVLAGVFLYFTDNNEIRVDDLNIYIDRIKQDLYWRDICFIIPDVSYLETKKSKYFTLKDDVVCLNKMVTRDILKEEINIDEDLIDAMTSDSVRGSASWEIILRRNERKHNL